MTRADIEQTFEREIDYLDREARDNGHDPHPWADDNSTGRSRHTACRKCGWTMVVRLYSDGAAFTSGLKQQCKGAKT